MEYDNSGRASRTYGCTGPGVTLNIVSAVGIALTFLLLLNRLFWRWKKDTFGFDDLLIVASWILLLVLGVVSMKAVDYGYGRKQSSLTPIEASNAERLFYVYQIIYKLTINTCKLSILILYLRCFGAKTWFGYVSKGLLVIVTIYTFSILMANIFICSPVSLYWDTKLSGAAGAAIRKSHCINVLAYWYASSLYNILSESVMLFSVLIRVWTLPSSKSQPTAFQFRHKVNLTVVLGLGVFTVATAILRMTTLSQTAMTSDKTGGTLTSTIWSTVEAGLGIAVANLPMIRQLLRWRGWCGGRWFSSTAGKSREHSRQQHRSSRSACHHSISEVNHNMNLDRLHTLNDRGQHIHLQSDFGRSTVHGEQGERSGCDVEAQGPISRQLEVEFLDVGASSSRTTRAMDGARGSKRLSGSISGATLKGRSDSDAPSFTSTMSPTEPVPIIKISIEPAAISLPPSSAQSTMLSCRESDGRF